MADNNGSEKNVRETIALLIVIFSTVIVAILAGVVISIAAQDTSNGADKAIDIFKTILPVFTAWVSTVLVFYFGQKSFEAASRSAQQLVGVAAQRAQTAISEIMRDVQKTVVFRMESGEEETHISQLRDLLKQQTRVTRLPIVDAADKPKYMIHVSALDKYEVNVKGGAGHTLAQFLSAQREGGVGYGSGQGFVTVARNATVADAKRLLDQHTSCQDIFVTERGTADEPLAGWISNIRLEEYLTA